jgi:putative FmdB family regulatory protein
MPTYEYECKSCGHVFEAFQSMKDEPLTVCPECGKAVRRRINGGTGVIFKGNGFYITDKPYGGQAASLGPKKEKERERDEKPKEPAASSPAGSSSSKESSSSAGGNASTGSGSSTGGSAPAGGGSAGSSTSAHTGAHNGGSSNPS